MRERERDRQGKRRETERMTLTLLHASNLSLTRGRCALTMHIYPGQGREGRVVKRREYQYETETETDNFRKNEM